MKKVLLLLAFVTLLVACRASRGSQTSTTEQASKSTGFSHPQRPDNMRDRQPLGQWNPMEWNSLTSHNPSKEISVSTQGSTFTARCLNYKSFWISSVEINGKIVVPDDRLNFSHESVNILVEEGNLTVRISPNRTDKPLKVKVVVSAGNVFDTFFFQQLAKAD